MGPAFPHPAFPVGRSCGLQKMGSFVKKRITHKVLAKQFVHKTLLTVDETFEDFLDAIERLTYFLENIRYGQCHYILQVVD